VHGVVALDAHGQHQGGEAAAEHRVGVPFADADAQAGRHPVAEALEQVVVDALGHPPGQHAEGDPVALPRVGVAEHGGQLAGQVGEGTVLGHLVAVGHDTLPERRLHAVHPATWVRALRSGADVEPHALG
jgi:hypothetical protein